MEIKVVTWNILDPAPHMSKDFVKVPEKYKEWDYRKNQINFWLWNKLKGTDIICLQEVENPADIQLDVNFFWAYSLIKQFDIILN